MTTVRLEHLTKRYPDGTIGVEDITLRAEEGEFLAIVGPSGCGKSTLLRLIAGLEEVTSGEIYFGTERLTHRPPHERDVGMVFQNYALYPHMTVAENLSFPLRVRKVPRAERERRVRDIAALLGLNELLHRYPKQLSGGQQQRVAVGRALVRSPRVFLFDEPLSNLDAGLRAEMRIELAALQRRLGITTIYVTHDHTEAMTMGDRIAVLRNGRLVQVGTPTSFIRILTIYLSRVFGMANDQLPCRYRQCWGGRHYVHRSRCTAAPVALRLPSAWWNGKDRAAVRIGNSCSTP